ncbi:lipopolysaccharide biosynthesis protein [Loktanella sp. S4079]|uniref:lipopolysaccharide biosynthesis protein n=1 Tax=Loktanella sp. S4079 TaxID=579483 RepID=UPI0005FA7119|nr:hypothetical protein [Loktanella sp. S4079]KJZ20670.1 hypothetical protein TW80_07830 [Loktanella sp. S4079]
MISKSETEGLNTSKAGIERMIPRHVRDMMARHAFGALALRAGMVALNFGIMMGIAAWVGMAAFGQIAVMWSTTLVVAPIIACGGPLLILRNASQGRMSGFDFLVQAVLIPGAACVCVAFVSGALWPNMAWGEIVLGGFFINLLSCLASALRGRDSVNISMITRDCVPLIALGAAVFIGGPDNALRGASLVMGAFAVFALLYLIRAQMFLITVDVSKPSMGLWGTSVLGVALSQVDIIVGGSVLSDAQMGIYALVRRVANLIALPVTVSTWVTAKTIAQSHRDQDTQALRRASDTGNRIAFGPAVVLWMVVIVGLGGLSNTPFMVGFILATTALLQVAFASSLPVATLSELPHFAAISRAMSVIAYAVMSIFVASMLGNAIAYAIAIVIGCVFLWCVLWRKLGVDTSVMALLSSQGIRWRLS